MGEEHSKISHELGEAEMDEQIQEHHETEHQLPVPLNSPRLSPTVATSEPMRRSSVAEPPSRSLSALSTNHRRQRRLRLQQQPPSTATAENMGSPTLLTLSHDLTVINSALASDPNAQFMMALNNNSTPNSASYSSFLESPGAGNSLSGNSRLGPSAGVPQSPHQSNANGNGVGLNGINVGVHMSAGQQMDVNMLYQKVMELSDVLKENREKTQGIVAGAEELATRAAAAGAIPSLQEANAEVTSARIADLERQLAHEQNKIRVLIQEQKENTRLIGEYETAVGNIVEMVRNYSFNNKTERTALTLHYNKLLQEEKDAHLMARLEKDDWHTKFMRSVEMLREAYRRRCEEDDVPVRIVSGLQNEVRAYRNALGMELERPEDEYGYELLKDVVVDEGGDS